MNRLLLILALLLIIVMPQAWGASNQYPNPYRQTMWNNITDSMHTLGQNPQKAKLIKNRLHNARTNARIQEIRNANKAKMQAWQNSQSQLP